MGTHLDGNMLNELPEAIQEELGNWVRANWTRGALTTLRPDDAPPALGDDFTLDWSILPRMSLLDVIREDGTVVYLFDWGPDSSLISTRVTETEPLPEHLTQYFESWFAGPPYREMTATSDGCLCLGFV